MSTGGVLLAGLAIILGFVFQANANFATSYVRDQLSDQKILFPAVDNLTEAETGVSCLIKYAGTVLDSGKKSECYANEYIGDHLKGIGGGETYASLGTPQRELQSQVDAANIESARVPLVVTVNALPTEVITAITGTAPVVGESAVAIGKYVGTTAQFTYTVPAFVDSTLNYVWTVPNGTNIVSGQGTNTLVVNYANVPSGVATTYGTITIQAENANGCRTTAVSLKLSKALPVAPASLKLYNKNVGSATPTTAIVKMSRYMGTSIPLTLTAAPVATATSYEWELPAGVTLATGGTPGTSYVRWYTAQPFEAPLTTQPAPSIGTKYWRVTYNPVTYNVNGVSTVVTTSTCSLFIQGGSTYGATFSQPYAPYGTVISSDKPAILISFAGATNPAITAAFLGVKSKNGVGVSVTNNNTAANAAAIAANIPGINYTTYSEVYTAPIPTTTNATVTITATGTTPTTARLLKLTAVLPSTPGVLSGQITGLCAGNTYTYTMATAAAEASSYNITAPVGSIVTSPSNTANTTNTLNSSDLSFSVQLPSNFASLTTPTIVVYSHNILGDSLLNKTLTLTPAMAAVTTVAGSATTFQRCLPQTFTLNAAPGATTYTWTVANGAVITSGQGTSSVTVDFSAVLSTVTSTKITVTATNGCGVTSGVKTITLASTTCAAKMATATRTENAIAIYPNPASDSFNMDVTLGNDEVASMAIITIDGTVVRTKKLDVTSGFNTVTENIADLSTGIYFVQFVNETTNETIVKKLVKK